MKVARLTKMSFWLIKVLFLRSDCCLLRCNSVVLILETLDFEPGAIVKPDVFVCIEEGFTELY